MKNIHAGRYVLLLAISGLLLSFGCAKEQAVDADLQATEQAPETIKLEISVKDERQKTTHVKSAEEAPKAPVVEKKNCTPRTMANSANTSPWGGAMGSQFGGQNNPSWPNGASSKAGAPWNLGNGNGANQQWPGMGAGQQQWPSLAQNNQWGNKPGLTGQSQWPTAGSSAPQAPTVVDATVDCVDGGYAGAPGFAGGPAPYGAYPASPFFSPYGPYFVADVVVSDDDGFGRRHHNSSDDEHLSDDDNFSDDDAVINDDDL